MTLLIDSVQDISTAASLHAQLSEAIVPGGATDIDLSAVTTADLSLVQTIEAARRHADEVGARLQLCAEPSPAVAEVLALAGFFDAADPATTQFWTSGAQA